MQSNWGENIALSVIIKLILATVSRNGIRQGLLFIAISNLTVLIRPPNVCWKPSILVLSFFLGPPISQTTDRSLMICIPRSHHLNCVYWE